MRKPDNLHSMCLADFASSYVTKKVDDLPIVPYKMKSFTVPVCNIDDVKLIPVIIILRMSLVKCRKLINLVFFIFKKCFN